MRGAKWVVLIALALGMVTAGLVYSYVNNLSRTARPSALATVVVATTDIQARAKVTASMVTVKQVPKDAVHPDACLKLDEAVGRFARSDIVAGEQVLRSRLFSEAQGVGLTVAIPPGKRAVTVAVNEVIGVAGFVRPGDRVDVLATVEDPTRQPRSAIVVTDVEVLAISQEAEAREDAKPRVVTSVTLAVTPREAQRIALAEEVGSLRLALRPLGSGDAVPGGVVAATSGPISTADLFGVAVGGHGGREVSVATAEPATTTATSGTGGRSSAVGTSTRGAGAGGGATGAGPSAGQGAFRVVEVIKGTQRSFVTLEGERRAVR